MSTVNGFQVGSETLKYNYESLENYNTPEFSTTKTYAVGDYVMYQGKLYKCTTAVTTAGSWSSSNWALAVLSDDVSSINNALNNATGNLTPNAIVRTNGLYIDASGTLTTGAATDRTIVVEVAPNKLYKIKKSTSTVMRVGCGSAADLIAGHLCGYSGHVSASSDALFTQTDDTNRFIYIQLFANNDSSELQSISKNVETLGIVEALGEEELKLNDKIEDMLVASEEISFTVAQGNIIYSNGASGGSSGTLYNKRVRIGYVPINNFGIKAIIKTGIMAEVFYYKSDHTFIGYDSKMYVDLITKRYSDAAYIRLAFAYPDDSNITVSDLTDTYLYNITNTDIKLSQSGKAADAKAVGELIGGMKSVNRFDKNSSGIVSGALNKNTGSITTGSGFSTSDYFEVSDIKTITTSYVVVVCFYDSTKTFISGSGIQYSNYDTADNSASVPNGAMYARISYKTASVDVVQAGDNVSRFDYFAYNGRFSFDKLRLNGNQITPANPIVVAPSGGDYTSFTQAVYDNIGKKCEIVVKPGTYDIVSEYVALFGQEVVDALADDTDLSGFQYGIRVYNKKIVFEAGSHLVCDWTGHTVNGTHRFSVFSIAADAELDGLDLDCTAVFYAIHDDYGSVSTPVYKIYRNCRITGHNIYNDNIIGGGCRPFAKYTIDNCYFDNGGSATSICVRYHNSNVAGSEPVLWISNCYFGQRLSFRWYGTQTTKMRVYVNNCTANSIYKGAEGSATNDNIELYKWNNEETGT